MAILVQSNKKPSISFPSQTGSIVTFNSQYAGLPLKSCVVNIPVTQEGTGDPSPDNVRNFVGVDSLDFSATGKNLLDTSVISGTFAGVTYANDENGIVSLSGTKYGVTYASFPNTRISMRAGTSYTFGINLLSGTIRRVEDQSVRSLQCYLTSIDNVNVMSVVVNEDNPSRTITVTPDEDVIVYLRFAWWLDSTIITDVRIQMQVEKNITSTDYAQYNGTHKIFTFGQTIYAGELDVLTGIFKATHKLAVFDGSENWVKSSSYSGGYHLQSWVSSNSVIRSTDHLQNIGTTVENLNEYSAQTNVCYFEYSLNFKVDNDIYPTVADFKNFLSQNNLQIWYPLPTPEVINLGGMDIETLQGENNLFASTGETTVEYIKIGG